MLLETILLEFKRTTNNKSVRNRRFGKANIGYENLVSEKRFFVQFGVSINATKTPPKNKKIKKNISQLGNFDYICLKLFE